MPKLPKNYEELIGKPQVIARTIELDGKQVLVRLQKPFEEPAYDQSLTVKVKLKDGKPVLEQVPPKRKDDSYIVYGTVLVLEAWSDATKSVVTTGIKKTSDQTEESFSFGVRYMLNNSTDAEIVEVIKAKRLDTQLKFQCSDLDTAVKFTNPPRLEKKKPNEI